VNLEAKLTALEEKINELQEGSEILLALKGDNLTDEDKESIKKNSEMIEKLIFEQEWLQFECFCNQIKAIKTDVSTSELIKDSELSKDQIKQAYALAKVVKKGPLKKTIEADPAIMDLYFEFDKPKKISVFMNVIASIVGE